MHRTLLTSFSASLSANSTRLPLGGVLRVLGLGAAAVTLLLAPLASAQQITVSPDGHLTATCDCRPPTPEERQDPLLAPDGLLQETPRASYSRGSVPLPLVPDWVGSRTRATGVLTWFDADNDGDEDLFVGTYYANMYPPLEDYYNYMYLNEGGMLEDEPSWISVDQRHTGDADWGLINDDPYPDLFLANGGPSFQPCQVFFGHDGLLPTSAGWQNIGGAWATGCDLADFDLDGDLDVATSNQGVYPDSYRPVYLYRNDGGTLGTTPMWQSSQVGITGACAWGDMDGDGYPDLAVSGWSNWNTGVFRNLGNTLDPNFAWTTGVPSRTDKGVGWAHVDQDAHLDLAVGGNGDPDWIFLNEGTILSDAPAWASEEPFNGCQELDWVDIDNDGDMDLANVHFSTGHVRIYLNENGTFATTADWQFDASSSATAIAFGDVNGDGWLDLAMGVANGPIALFLNEQLPAAADDPRPAPLVAEPLRLRIGGNPVREHLSLAIEADRPVRPLTFELLDATGRRLVHRPLTSVGFVQMAHPSVNLATETGGTLTPGMYLVRVTAEDEAGRVHRAQDQVVWMGR